MAYVCRVWNINVVYNLGKRETLTAILLSSSPAGVFYLVFCVSFRLHSLHHSCKLVLEVGMWPASFVKSNREWANGTFTRARRQTYSDINVSPAPQKVKGSYQTFLSDIWGRINLYFRTCCPFCRSSCVWGKPMWFSPIAPKQVQVYTLARGEREK